MGKQIHSIDQEKLTEIGISTGVLAGAPVGGVLYAFGGKELPFLVIASLVALDGIARWILLAEPPHIEVTFRFFN